MRYLSLSAVILLSLCLFIPSESFAFKTYPGDPHWHTGVLEYKINDSFNPGFNESSVIQASGQAWTNTPAAIQINYTDRNVSTSYFNI